MSLPVIINIYLFQLNNPKKIQFLAIQKNKVPAFLININVYPPFMTWPDQCLSQTDKNDFKKHDTLVHMCLKTNQCKCDHCDSWFDIKFKLEKHTKELHNQNSTKHTIDREPSLQNHNMKNIDQSRRHCLMAHVNPFTGVLLQLYRFASYIYIYTDRIGNIYLERPHAPICVLFIFTQLWLCVSEDLRL